MHLVAAGTALHLPRSPRTRITSFRSKRSLAQQSAAVPGKIGAKPTQGNDHLVDLPHPGGPRRGQLLVRPSSTTPSTASTRSASWSRSLRPSPPLEGGAMTQFGQYLTEGGGRGLLRRHHQPARGAAPARPARRRRGRRCAAAGRLRRRRSPLGQRRQPRPRAAPARPARRPCRPRRSPSPGPTAARCRAPGRPPTEPRGAVLVIHENRGLTDHIRSVAGRLAASGYSALAIDLLSEEGGTASFADEAQVTAALNAAPDSRFVADMKAAIDELQRRALGGQGRRRRILLRRRHGLDTARRRRAPAGRRGPVLRPAARRRRLRRLPERRRPRRLRRAGRPGQRQPGRAPRRRWRRPA